MKKALLLLLLLSFSGCSLLAPRMHRELSFEECQSMVDNAETFVMEINQEETYGFIILDKHADGIYAIRSNEGEWVKLEIASKTANLSEPCVSEKAKVLKCAETALQDIQACYQNRLFETPYNDPMGPQELTLTMDLTKDGLAWFSNLGYNWTSGCLSLSYQTMDNPVSISAFLTDVSGNISEFEFGSVWVRRG